MKQKTVFIFFMGIFQASNAASEFTPFHSWSFGNGILIVGCNGTLDDVTQRAPISGVKYVNLNAQDRQSISVERSGNHTHEGCATLDILGSCRVHHIVYDITRPMDFIFFYGPTTIYLEKLFPAALFNPNYTPDKGTILHPETFMNCFHMLRPDGKIVFDFSHNFFIKPGAKEAEFNWDPALSAVTVETKHCAIFAGAFQKKSSGQSLNEVEERLCKSYSDYTSKTVLTQIRYDLEDFGFTNCSISNDQNPFNGRTVSQFLISAEKASKSK